MLPPNPSKHPLRFHSCACSSRTSKEISISVSVNTHAQGTIWDGMQVMAILDRIKQQDAGKIEPPAIALSGMVGAKPASEGFMEQNASASRRQVQRAAAEADDEDGEVEEVWPHISPTPNLPDMWETGPLSLCGLRFTSFWQLAACQRVPQCISYSN